MKHHREKKDLVSKDADEMLENLEQDAEGLGISFTLFNGMVFPRVTVLFGMHFNWITRAD